MKIWLNLCGWVALCGVFAGCSSLDPASTYQLPVPHERQKGESQRVGQIRGRVFDASSGKPLDGVTVRLEGTLALIDQTDLAGQFLLVDVPMGEHEVRFSKSGYHPTRETRVFVFEDEAASLTVLLRSVWEEPHGGDESRYGPYLGLEDDPFDPLEPPKPPLSPRRRPPSKGGDRDLLPL